VVSLITYVFVPAQYLHLVVISQCPCFLDPDQITSGQDRISHLVRKPTEEATALFHASLASVFPLSAAHSAHPEHSEPFVPRELTNDHPKDLSTLHNPNTVGMDYHDLLDLCDSLLKVSISYHLLLIHSIDQL